MAVVLFMSVGFSHTDKEVLMNGDLCESIVESSVSFYDQTYGFGGDVDLALDYYFSVLSECKSWTDL